jgi:hypothetical protein
MDLLHVHKFNAKTSIAHIGTITSVLNFSSLCINMDSIITAITTADNLLPILHQFLMKFARVMINTKWACWFDATHVHMPLIHWHYYSFFKKVFNHVGDFATNFGNVVAVENHTILELNIQPLVHAINTMIEFKDNIILHQSLGTPIVTTASSIETYILNHWNKTNSCNKFCLNALSQVNNLGSKTNHQHKSTHTSHANTMYCTFARGKRNTRTNKSGAKPSLTQRQKKQLRAVTNDTVKRSQSDMGMFWLYNPKIRMSEIFPRDLLEKVSIQFCCRGRECKKELATACPFLQPCSPNDLKLETIKLIGDHFMAKKIGWFNEYHFLKLTGLKPKYKTLIGGKDRPSSKMA